VSCIQDLLVRSHSRILELILNSPKPIISIQRLSGLSESGWVGVLEIPELGLRFIITIATIVIVVVGG
jgi:hypothetical protein